MSGKNSNQVFELLVRVLPVIHKKIHRDVFKATIEQSGIDMAPHHLMILKMLRDNSYLSMSEIAEDIAISQSQMTHSIDKLIKLGMVKRYTPAQDRRKINIRLTVKGREYLEKLDPVMKSRLESKLSELSDIDMARLATSLADVADIFNRLQWE